MSGLAIERCRVCGTAAFPRRIWCPTCGAHDWAPERATRGLVTETTLVRRAVGADAIAEPPRLATVVLEDGPPVIAGFDGPVQAGDQVDIAERDGAPWASRIE